MSRDALVPTVLLAVAVVVSGCVAAAAAGGAAAGAKMAEDEAQEDIEYWLKTNDTTTRIGRAMKEERVIEGMTKTHVKLILDAHSRYDTFPTRREEDDQGRMVWVYEPELDRYAIRRYTFEDGRVVAVDETTVETQDKPSPRGTGTG